MTDRVKTQAPPGLWFPNFRPNERATLRLFCFPYAGGQTSIYRRWPGLLPDFVEVCAVQLPGRGNRIREAPYRRLTETVEAVRDAVAPLLDKPFAFFGHSMGALIGYELAHVLRQERGLEPARLFVSGRRPPHLPDREPATYHLPEPEFIEELRRLNGTPQEVLGHQELMQLILPLLRADFEVCQTYEYRERPPLGCPVSAFGGVGDSHVTQEDLAAWRGLTTGPFSKRMFAGDHFYLHSSESYLLQALSRELY